MDLSLTNQSDQIIFVVGCPRSGTTLLQNILMNVKDSFSMPETHYFEWIAINSFIAPRSLPPFGNFIYPEKVDRKRAMLIIADLRKNSMLNFTAAEEKEVIAQADAGELTIEKFFLTISSSYANVGQKILIEKTPCHVYHIAKIRQLFPKAIIIGIIRDPRDTYISFNKMLDLQTKKRRSIAEFCHIWNTAAKEILEKKIDYIVYEKLIINPIQEVNRVLCKYGLLIADLDNNGYKKIVPPNEIWKDKVNKAIIKDNIKQYQKKLDQKTISLIDHYCYQEMARFGNERERNSFAFVAYLADSVRWLITRVVINLSILKNKLHNL